MKSKIFSLLFIIILAVQLYSPLTLFHQENNIGIYSSKLDYTYVEIYEKGEWWIYVYDGTVLIDRYLLED